MVNFYDELVLAIGGGLTKTFTRSLDAADDIEGTYTEVDAGTNVTMSGTTATIKGNGSNNANGIISPAKNITTPFDVLEINWSLSTTTGVGPVFTMSTVATLSLGTSDFGIYNNTGNLTQLTANRDTTLDVSASTTYNTRVYFLKEGCIWTIQGGSFTNETLITAGSHTQNTPWQTSSRIQIQMTSNSGTCTINTIKWGTVTLSAASGGGGSWGSFN
jgi:hypothetical protein